MKTMLMFSCLALCCFVIAVPAAAQAKQRVSFARGTSSTTVRGTVRGYAYRDYVVDASAGQTLDVKVRSANTYTVFTVFQPGGDNLEGAAQMDEFSGELPTSGDYVVRVAMMRAGARRPGAVSNFSLTISIK
jgi:hypothetical protein